MSRVLIIKTGAAGDVLRTTPLLRALKGEWVTWLVSEANLELLPYHGISLRLTDPNDLKGREFDYVFSLEDDYDLLEPLGHPAKSAIKWTKGWFGYYVGRDRHLHSQGLRDWYEMGLSSPLGLKEANRLKIASRKSYQQHIFEGLNIPWNGEEYVMPTHRMISNPPISGDIAFAVDCGPRWPSRRWAFYDQAIEHFRQRGYTCNVLPRRQHILQHIADIKAHRVLVSGVSLPMHIGIGLGMQTVAFFTCINPDEIEGYGRLHKVISPKWRDYFMTRDVVPECMSAIPLDEGIAAIDRAIKTADAALVDSWFEPKAPPRNRGLDNPI
jgi:heptosyltransferase-2